MNITDEIARSIPIRRAFIWNKIIQLAFLPQSEIDQKSWIRLFKQNLLTFWGFENQPVSDIRHSTTNIRITYPGITHNDEMIFDCKISSSSQFSVNVLYGQDLWWIHDYNSNFFVPSPNIFLPVILKHSREDVFQINQRNDIEDVIDGLILHPCAHQHIAHPVDNHEIRFGGGITNPYLYLFHLRYQLCPLEDRRNRERVRLTDLFFNAINENRLAISANELMTIP
jgi:hypothetical protein